MSYHIWIKSNFQLMFQLQEQHEVIIGEVEKSSLPRSTVFQMTF